MEHLKTLLPRRDLLEAAPNTGRNITKKQQPKEAGKQLMASFSTPFSLLIEAAAVGGIGGNVI